MINDITAKASDPNDLERKILDPNISKNEAEWWARERILRLEKQLAEAQADSSTAWAQAHRLALELECLIMDTKDNAIVSKWWDSAFEAMEEYHKLKPGAAEDAEAWAKIRKAGI